MATWLVSCFLLTPIPMRDERGARADANQIVADALAAEATWQTFPGFMADLEIECQDKVSQGRLIVGRDGRMFVEQVPDSHRVWAVQHLSCVIQRRLPRDDVGKKTWMFVNPQNERAPLGYAVCRADDPFGPCHWVQNQQFRAVEVRFAKSKQRLTTLKTERNPDNKYLPAVQVLHLWNARTLELEGTETRLLSWRRMGGLDLPATIQVLSAGTTDTFAIGRIVLTRHRLFAAPQALFAIGHERRQP